MAEGSETGRCGEFDTLFRTTGDQAGRLARAVERHAPQGPLRVLDVGCGDGATLLSLHSLFPDWSLVGLDVSAPNIEAARASARGARQIEFVLGDWMRTPTEAFDVVLSATTLHLIAAPAQDILDKLAASVRPGGLAVLTLPCECAFNTLLIGVRRVCRALRCRAMDAAVLLAGRVLTRGRYDAEFLRQRLGYMYVIPGLLDGPRLRRELAGRGLAPLETADEPHASIAQPRHTLLVLRKEA